MLPYEAFAACYDALMADVDYGAWADYLVSLIREHGAPEPTLLDAACGTGALTLPLQKAGFSVTGADASPAMLAKAAEKARVQGLPVVFVRQDLRSLELHAPVGTVNCALDGVNYLATEADLAAFFTSAAAALKPDGLLLFDVSTPHKFENVIGDRTIADETEDAAFIWYNAYDQASALCTMELTLFVREADGRYGRFEEEHVQRAHTLRELGNAMRGAGFAVLGAYSFLSRAPAQENDERWQVVAQKVKPAYGEA